MHVSTGNVDEPGFGRVVEARRREKKKPKLRTKSIRFIGNIYFIHPYTFHVRMDIFCLCILAEGRARVHTESTEEFLVFPWILIWKSARRRSFRGWMLRVVHVAYLCAPRTR